MDELEQKLRRKEIKRKHYLKNKDNILAKNKEYRDKNIDKVLEMERTSYKKHYANNKDLYKTKREDNKDQAKVYRDKYRKDNKDVLLEKARLRLATPEYKQQKKEYNQTLKGKYYTYKRTSKQRKILFELTLEQFSLFWQTTCTYCGDQIETIGLDRIDSDDGYNLNNIVSCCTTCNYMKLNHSNNKFMSHIKKIYDFNKGKYESNTAS